MRLLITIMVFVFFTGIQPQIVLSQSTREATPEAVQLQQRAVEEPVSEQPVSETLTQGTLEEEISAGLFEEGPSKDTFFWGFLNMFIISTCIVVLRLFRDYA